MAPAGRKEDETSRGAADGTALREATTMMPGPILRMPWRLFEYVQGILVYYLGTWMPQAAASMMGVGLTLAAVQLTSLVCLLGRPVCRRRGKGFCEHGGPGYAWLWTLWDRPTAWRRL